MGRIRAGGTTALLLLSLASCGGGGNGGVTGPTVPPGDDATTTSTGVTTTTAVSYEVPETIDQAYVQRVVSAYDKVLGDAIRVLKREGRVTDEFLEHLVGIYTAEEYEFQQKLWLESVAQGRLERTPDEPGDPTTEVGALAQSDAECVVFRAERNLEANLEGEQVESEQDDYIVLIRKPADRDPRNVNPTPWAMAFDGYKVDNSVPVDRCAG